MFFSGNSVDGTVYLEPSTDGRKNRVTGRLPQRDFDNEQDLMGASSYGVGYCAFVCKQPDHWVYEGTGMKLNDSIPDLVGWEYHGPPMRDDPSLVVLAKGKTRRYRDETNREYAAVLYTAAKGNFVFNASSCWWADGLATPPGYVRPSVYTSPKGPNPRAQRITANILERMQATSNSA